ncbi:GNAT family N-acetyltransferase [Staphylococcus sp. GSSP0090]|nr:GNAT family N-acetyltransferase [Staphylococcus sp. GSSP0090]
MYHFRNVAMSDLNTILKIENHGFSPEEAASKEALINRINFIKDTFIVADYHGDIAGYINGPVINQPFITDDLFDESIKNAIHGGYIAILGLVVAENYRKQGLAGKLLNHLEHLAIEQERQGITLTCKASLISFYEQYGYINHGVSESQHGGMQWFNLVKHLD